MCLAVGSGGTVLKFTGLGSSPLVSSLTGNQHSDRHPQRLHADTASSCSIFTSSIGAQTADGGSTGSQISAVPPLANGSVNAASCGGSGSALQWAALLRRTLETGYALVLATNGISSPTFEPSALLPSESFGGPDGSRPVSLVPSRRQSCPLRDSRRNRSTPQMATFTNRCPSSRYRGRVPASPSRPPTTRISPTVNEVANGGSSGPLGWGWSGTIL